MRHPVLISGIILSLATAAAETYLINPEGTEDFPTIPAAIDALVDGDVIELTDGTFTSAHLRAVRAMRLSKPRKPAKSTCGK